MDTNNLELLLNELIQISQAQYIVDLFLLGCLGAIIVLILLYKFLKLFY